MIPTIGLTETPPVVGWDPRREAAVGAIRAGDERAHAVTVWNAGDRLIGRGAYDMKGGLAAMMCALKDLEHQERVRVRLICVPDEESEELDSRSTDAVVKQGLGFDHDGFNHSRVSLMSEKPRERS